MQSGRDGAPSAVVFDLDGTLIDSRGDIAAALNHVLMTTGRSALTTARAAELVGDGSRSLIARAAGLVDTAPELDGLVEAFVRYYTSHPADFTKWVDGAPEVFDRLAGFGMPVCLCTNKARPVTEAVLAALGIRDRFRAIWAGGDSPERKPSPEPLLHLARQLGVDPTTLVMVGDGPQDVEAARAAGCRVLGLASVYTPRARIEGAKPDVVLDGLGEVPGVVRTWCDVTTRLTSFRLT